MLCCLRSKVSVELLRLQIRREHKIGFEKSTCFKENERYLPVLESILREKLRSLD